MRKLLEQRPIAVCVFEMFRLYIRDISYKGSVATLRRKYVFTVYWFLYTFHANGEHYMQYLPEE
jgi:hypothetical protein